MPIKMLFSLSINRILNYILLNLSYLLSSLTGSVFLWGKPSTLSIETSGKCQLACPECHLSSNKNNKRGFISLELFNKIINSTKKHCIACLLYFQGEAFLHPQIFELIKICNKARIYSIISTNACVTKNNWAENVLSSGLNHLIISLDGFTQTSYNKYRKNGDLNQVISNLKSLSELLKKEKKSHLKVTIQFLAMQHNIHEIPQVKKFAKSLNFKVSLKSIQIQDLKKENTLLPSQDKYRRYNKTHNGYQIKNKLHNRCKRLHSHPVITSNGDVLPCCFDKGIKHSMGNLNNTSLYNIWNSKVYNEFRKKVFNQRKNIDICTNCTEGTKQVYV